MDATVEQVQECTRPGCHDPRGLRDYGDGPRPSRWCYRHIGEWEVRVRDAEAAPPDPPDFPPNRHGAIADAELCQTCRLARREWPHRECEDCREAHLSPAPAHA